MAWRTAIAASPKLVTVTSFNEWHEGTQIEEAVPKATADNRFTYLSYEPHEPDFYLVKTRECVDEFVNSLKKR